MRIKNHAKAFLAWVGLAEIEDPTNLQHLYNRALELFMRLSLLVGVVAALAALKAWVALGFVFFVHLTFIVQFVYVMSVLGSLLFSNGRASND